LTHVRRVGLVARLAQTLLELQEQVGGVGVGGRLGEEVGGERGEEGERVVERRRRRGVARARVRGREFGRFELAERGEQVVAGGELGLEGASARRDLGWRRQSVRNEKVVEELMK
jgi:hypothetical protein